MPVTLVSSRDRVLPGEDPDAADVIEEVFTARGGTLVKQARAAAVPPRRRRGRRRAGRRPARSRVARADVRRLGAEHRRTSGSSTSASRSTRGGYIATDRVSRTNVPTIYAAGDCTGVLLLASVAGMQGRIAMWHALGEAVAPLRLKTVAANVFTHPEIATVGIGYAGDQLRARCRPARSCCRWRPTPGPRCRATATASSSCTAARPPASSSAASSSRRHASELIFPLTLAVQRGLTVATWPRRSAVYPSLSGSIAEAARRLMLHDDLD